MSHEVSVFMCFFRSLSPTNQIMSHQSDWIYYKQPIKFLVVKVNGMREVLILIQFRTAIFILQSIKQEEVFIYWAYFDIFCGLG